MRKPLPELLHSITDASWGEVKLRQGSYLMNGLELQPIQAELRVSLSHLHAQHWFSMEQIVEGTLAGGSAAEKRKRAAL